MEKRRSHYPLQLIRRLAEHPEQVTMTKAAQLGAADLGADVPTILQVLKALRPEDFYKSMTSYGDSALWHDVYRPIVAGTTVYLKLIVIPDHRLLVVSFKRK